MSPVYHGCQPPITRHASDRTGIASDKKCKQIRFEKQTGTREQTGRKPVIRLDLLGGPFCSHAAISGGLIPGPDFFVSVENAPQRSGPDNHANGIGFTCWQPGQPTSRFAAVANQVQAMVSQR